MDEKTIRSLLIKIKLTAFLLFAFIVTLGAQDYTATSPFLVYLKSDMATFSDPQHVEVDIHIKNRSSESHSFFMIDRDFITLQPLVYDLTGREAETIVPYRLSGYDVQDMLLGARLRKISLEPGEIFVRTVNLADYYELIEDNDYKVALLFLPDARENKPVISNNVFYFKVKKQEMGFVDPYNRTTSLVAESSIRPYEVVSLFLSAEKSGRWKDFIKYIDMKQYIFSYPNFSQVYLETSKAGREKVLADFGDYLVRERSDKILEFTVGEEVVSGNRATVEAVVKRAGGGYPFVYKYIYTLEKNASFWKIINVQASVARDVSND